jgi:hypothetical protein
MSLKPETASAIPELTAPIAHAAFANGNCYMMMRDELVRTTFGANYEHLIALKNKYDPTNLFRLNIKPTVHEYHCL